MESKPEAIRLLEEWLKKEGRRKGWLADKLKINGSTLSRWLNASAIPQKNNRERIEEETSGAVPKGAWCPK